MAKRYPAGYITSQLITASTDSAPGIWSIPQSFSEISRSRWPRYVPPPFNLTYLIVAGGGSSGYNGGGGGGAGGVLQGNVTANAGLTFTVVVGSGGGGGPLPGSDSSLSNTQSSISLTAIGGGRGANRDSNHTASSGGSGGGGASATSGVGSVGYPGTPGQGYPGGNGVYGIAAGGGGGGAGGPGGNYSGSTGGSGGNGILSDITGTPVGYAGGGAGSGLDYGYDGISGTVHYSGGIWYGGGGWLTQFTLGQNQGRKNSGGGGGGIGDGNANSAGRQDSGGGGGGSGIVVLRYPGSQRGYGGNTYSVGGNTVHVFTDTGTFYTYLPSSPNTISTTNLVTYLDAGNALSFPGPNQTNYGYSYGMGTNTTWYNLITGGANATISAIDLGTVDYKGGVYFNGSSHNASIGNLGSGFSNFTVEIWFKPDNVANYRNPMDCNYSAGGNNVGPRLEMNSSGNLGWVYGSSAANYQGVNLLGSGLSTSLPYYAALTRSGTTYTGYLNGSQTTSGTETHAYTGSMTNVVIGQGYSSASERYFQGQVFVVRIYNRALSGAEISTNFSVERARFGI